MCNVHTSCHSQDIPKENTELKQLQEIVQDFCCCSVPFRPYKTKAFEFLWARAAKIYSLCQKGDSVFSWKRISPFMNKSQVTRAGHHWNGEEAFTSL